MEARGAVPLLSVPRGTRPTHAPPGPRPDPVTRPRWPSGEATRARGPGGIWTTMGALFGERFSNKRPPRPTRMNGPPPNRMNA